jgi:hypothetical protein
VAGVPSWPQAGEARIMAALAVLNRTARSLKQLIMFPRK